jgi:type II secretory pathway pseudopilin PulG
MFFLKTKSNTIPTSTRGVTFVEMLVYIAVSTIVLLAVTNTIISFYKNNRIATEQIEQLYTARRGTDTMINELRKANYSEAGNHPIIAVGTSSISFYSDYDEDGIVEKVRYYLSGTDFMRGVVEPVGITYTGAEVSSIISTYVRNNSQGVNIFYYYDTNGTLMASPSTSMGNIRYIQMKLIVNVKVETLPNEFMIRSSATLRNLKSNL